MLTNYKNSRNYYWVIVAVDSEKSKKIIDSALQLGVAHVFIGKGRGVLRKNKIGFVTVPSVSPLYDVLNLLVPKENLNLVMRTLIHEGHLNHFGAGSIYATRIQEVWYSNTELFSDINVTDNVVIDVEMQKDLIAINCVCQLNHAEEIAQGAMLAGSASPTVSFGYGHGIRDMLGFFLQLTINPKKEFIELVVGAAEAERIFEIMVSHGHLDKPAMGFISMRPVEIGLINMMSYQNNSEYPATMEQIIKAIDQLQGNTKWRSSGTIKTIHTPTRKKLLNLVSLNCIVNRGFGDICSMAAMEAGAGGTSTCFANAVPIAKHASSLDGSDEREIINMTIPENAVKPVIDAMVSLKELEGTPVVLYTCPAPKALTYLP